MNDGQWIKEGKEKCMECWSKNKGGKTRKINVGNACQRIKVGRQEK